MFHKCSPLELQNRLTEVKRTQPLMILKRVSENVSFQINKFTACKFKDKKEVANSLMTLNLLKIIDPFQGKKHLRT